jgi:hypothetical protein
MTSADDNEEEEKRKRADQSISLIKNKQQLRK